jgi:hypothetical protein
MNRSLLMILAALLVTGPALADLHPPERALQPVTDPSMVVQDRGAKLEVLSTERATATVDSSGVRVLQRKIVASAGASIGPHQLGVVFNHAMQARGYITGEITFMAKAGRTFTTQNPQLYPGLKVIVAPSLYAVTARTPAEFIRVLKRLQARPDIEWVEPTVTYEAAAAAPNSAQ